MNKGMWLASLFLFFGGLLLIAASQLYASYQKHKQTGSGRAEARVVDLVLKEGRNVGSTDVDFRNIYYPVFEYYADGMLYKKVGKRGSYPSDYKVGQKVRIEYDLENPNRYRIVTDHRKYYIWDAMGICGIVMVAAAVAIFIRFAVRH